VDGGSTTYTLIGEITSIKPPSVEREAIDASHLNSPGDVREYIAGMLNAGAVNIGLNHKPHAADPLLAAIIAGKIDLRITYRGGVQIDFHGIPTAWEPGEVTGDKLSCSFTMQPNGLPQITGP
ncbi:MAG: phage tail tube protein, partial [Pseudomonadota bacterium]|nr:phage tail tube protein [Pseudomonadota bacterium]